MNKIIQGTNKPILISFEEATTITALEISLYNDLQELKHWSLSDVTNEDNLIICGLTQEETINFPEGRANLEIKWLTAEGEIEQYEVIPMGIEERKDKTLMGV